MFQPARKSTGEMGGVAFPEGNLSVMGILRQSKSARASRAVSDQYVTRPITQSAARPNEASATGAQTGPFPTGERIRAEPDAQNPSREDATAKAYFTSPSGRRLAWKAAMSTDKPIAETKIKSENARIVRHLGGAKRGVDFDHRTQAQISDGIGKRYPARPMKITYDSFRPDCRKEGGYRAAYFCNRAFASGGF